MAMIPALQLIYWQWLSLTLAAPVVVWGGLPFYRAAWSNLRHGAATMDTLVSIGALAAFGWSLYALFLGGAGLPGFTHPFHLTLSWSGGSSQIYLEVAAGVVTFVLAGRYAEAKARRRSGAALRALLSAGRQGGGGAARRARGTGAGRSADGRRPVRGPARREDRRRRRGRRGRVRGRPQHDHRRAGCRWTSPRATEVSGGCVNVDGRLVVRATRVGDGHPAGPDRRAGRGCADRQGRGAAAGRPGLRAVRPGGAHAGRGHLGVLARAPGPAWPMAVDAATAVLIVACPCALGLATPDRAAGRHRPRGPARHPDHRPGGAGVHPPDRHHPAGQDRHHHQRRDDGDRRRAGRGRGPGRRARRWPARSRSPPSTRWPWPSPRHAADRLGVLPAAGKTVALDGLGMRGVRRRPEGAHRPPAADGRLRHRRCRRRSRPR